MGKGVVYRQESRCSQPSSQPGGVVVDKVHHSLVWGEWPGRYINRKSHRKRVSVVGLLVASC